jgi:hypothetical protein
LILIILADGCGEGVGNDWGGRAARVAKSTDIGPMTFALGEDLTTISSIKVKRPRAFFSLFVMGINAVYVLYKPH